MHPAHAAARAAMVQRLSARIDRANRDTNTARGAAAMAVALRKAPESWWVKFAATYSERLPSAETREALAALYDRRASVLLTAERRAS